MQISFNRLLTVCVGCVLLCVGCGLEGLDSNQNGANSNGANSGTATTDAEGTPGDSGEPVSDRSNLDAAEALQGTWKISNEGLPAEAQSQYNRYYIFSGNQMETRIETKVMQSGTFRVDTTKSPAVIVATMQRMTGRNPGGPVEGEIPFELLDGNTTLKYGEGAEALTLKFVR